MKILRIIVGFFIIRCLYVNILFLVFKFGLESAVMVVKKQICDQLNDQEIVKRSLEDVDFFACLYERYNERLKKYIQRISAATEEEIEDILQDAFIKIWRNLNEYDPGLKLSSWLYRIVHNETISFVRASRSYGKNNVIQLDKYILLELAETLELNSEIKDINILTAQVLGLMPDKYRKYLILRFFEKMSYEDISDVLRVPEGTVATRINRAKKLFIKIAQKEKISFNR